MTEQGNDPIQNLSLDLDEAEQLLNSVYVECNLPPSVVSVKMLEKWGNYKRSGSPLGQIVSIIFLAVLLVLPAAFFHPILSIQRLDADSAISAVYEIRTFLASGDITATINGKNITPDKVSGGKYTLELKENGILSITATAFNGQTSTKEYEIASLDTNKPMLIDSSTKNGIVHLIVEDTQTGVDFSSISITTPDGYEAESLTIDEATGSISFHLSEETLYVSIPDCAGNILNIIISPN